MQAKSWLLLVEARVRAMCPPRYRDEVASEVLTSMWETARQPPGVKCPIALATALIPRFMGRHRRHEDRIRVTPPEHLDEMRSRGRLAMESCPFEFLLRSGLLVGWRQRRIVVCRLVGLDYHEIAQDLGTKVGEVNRVLQKLVEKLRRRRRLESAVFRLRS